VKRYGLMRIRTDNLAFDNNRLIFNHERNLQLQRPQSGMSHALCCYLNSPVKGKVGGAGDASGKGIRWPGCSFLKLKPELVDRNAAGISLLVTEYRAVTFSGIAARLNEFDFVAFGGVNKRHYTAGTLVGPVA
jgi:hypothetical protein